MEEIEITKKPVRVVRAMHPIKPDQGRESEESSEDRKERRVEVKRSHGSDDSGRTSPKKSKVSLRLYPRVKSPALFRRKKKKNPKGKKRRKSRKKKEITPMIVITKIPISV